MATRPLVTLVTGASSGFGALSVRALAKSGNIVYAGFLQPNNDKTTVYKDAATFAEKNSCQLRGIELNVVKEDSIKKAVNQIMADQGRIDVVVHNAGHMNYGPAESFTPEQFLEMYEVNCLSCHRINRVVLPHMRKAGRGLLVWVSSGSAHGPSSPFMAPYFAAKAAQDSLAQTYAVELTQFGIETSIVVPGVFTRGTSHFTTAMKPGDPAVEKEYLEGPLKGWDRINLEGHDKVVSPDADPAAVAEAVRRIVDTEHGKRPFRVHVEFDGGGATIVNGVRDLVRKTFLTSLGLADLLKVKVR
ncbi:estradiol 17beta-dehydrogenase [Capronia coronata CBS 617.96]|uniref:Estradiol 17beta-dehydrogenase n=1 Tax=Capronia coronata CBS 617.96 TaxID=1182541 RepID=W9YDG6_9EURO|nr:estradiol 17beta-dehydrogenase [Capronia coronata CBS 617.96]EXJ90902.1 estradiol 17beta-dehydrogenase [Capronia coronata CBS 617.96]